MVALRASMTIIPDCQIQVRIGDLAIPSERFWIYETVSATPPGQGLGAAAE